MPSFPSFADAAAVTLDRETAHKRIALSEGYTKATIVAKPLKYPDSPRRFTVYYQVLADKGFTRGRHYWEILVKGNNFGIGLAYHNIERKGPTSRLGHNSLSWCVEWLNSKLSVWHNSHETLFEKHNCKCVGVLLDCDRGTATFYCVGDIVAVPILSIFCPFTKAVYPAFWVSSSSMSLHHLQA